jgi:4'-phosphopantetheinyl transferase EntD
MINLRREITFHRSNKRFVSYLSICKFEKHDDIEVFKNTLSKNEKTYYHKVALLRKKTFLLGRIAAKDAINGYISDVDDSDNSIDFGVFEQPIVTVGKNIQVSITHTNESGLSIAFYEAHPLGIDLEEIERAMIIDTYLTDDERSMQNNCEKTLFYAIVWTAKESLSKCLKTGLMTPFNVYEIDDIEESENYFECTFTNFGQYKSLCFQKNDLMFAIALPRKSEISQAGFDGITSILQML